MRRLACLALLASPWSLAVASGCGREPLSAATTGAGGAGAGPNGGATGPSGAAAGSGGGRGGRVPRRHRAAAEACPAERGAGRLADVCPPDAGMTPSSLADCLHDEDCTAGVNGRCTTPGPIAICGLCSYDGCSADADCPGGVPCACRASGADIAPNRCETASDCAVDADCGPGGYCSPSVVEDFCFCPSAALCDGSSKCYAGTTEVPCVCGDSCGHGYFCHRSADACVDDEDCGTAGTCNFDRLAGRWQCALCWPIP